MVRPLKEINWQIVEKKMEAGCTAKEIMGSDMDSDTFYRRFKAHFGCGFADYSASAYSVGDGNLKFTQYMKALAGNTNMLTLLGRERLSQGKEPEREIPRDALLDAEHKNMLQAAEIEALKEKYGDKPQTEQELR